MRNLKTQEYFRLTSRRLTEVLSGSWKKTTQETNDCISTIIHTWTAGELQITSYKPETFVHTFAAACQSCISSETEFYHPNQHYKKEDTLDIKLKYYSEEDILSSLPNMLSALEEFYKQRNFNIPFKHYPSKTDGGTVIEMIGSGEVALIKHLKTPGIFSCTFVSLLRIIFDKLKIEECFKRPLYVLLLTSSLASHLRDIDHAIRLLAEMVLPEAFPITMFHLRIPWEVISKNDSIDAILRNSSLLLYTTEQDPKPSSPYEEMQHFRQFAWPSFLANQEEGGQFISNIIKNNCPSLRTIVDVGCGTGEILRHLHSNFPQSSCLGIDESIDQVLQCPRKEGLICEHVSFANMSSVISRPNLVLFTGNTLAHIGVKAFREWLENDNSQKRKPEYVIFDFASYWRDMVGHRERHELGTAPVKATDLVTARVVALLFTVIDETWVKRIIQLQWFESKTNKQDCIGKQTLITKQYPEPPEAYISALRAKGYEVSEVGRYTNGWGEHDLFLAKLTGQEPTLEWPLPRERESLILNSRWYESLQTIWIHLNLDDRLHGKFKHFKLVSPIAILPFCNQRIYARYLSREVTSGHTKK